MIPLSATQAGASPRERSLAVGAAVFVTGASTVIMGTLPLLTGFFADRLHLDWQQIGWLTAAGQVGTLIGTLLTYWLIEQGLLLRGLQLGTVVALAFSLMTAVANSFPTLLVSRVLTSAGAGCVFAVGAWVLGRTEHPARSFSLMSGVQVVCGSVHAVALPWIFENFGYVAAISSIAFWFVIILPIVLRPSGRAMCELDFETPRAARTSLMATGHSPVLLLGAVMAFQASVVLLWIYSERIGTASGLSPGEIGVAIALGTLGGLPASVLGSLAADRVGHLPLVFLATASVVVGAVLIFEASSVTAYTGGHFALNFGWMLGVSYYLGMLAEADASGRTFRLVPTGLVIAGGIGPLYVALLTSTQSAMPILAASIALCMGAYLLALWRRETALAR